MAEASNRTPDDELLWNYMLKQQDFSIETFTTALIGEGALLFAYGQLPPQDVFVRLLVVALGFGTGLVLTFHSYIARMDALTVRSRLRSDHSSIIKVYEDVHQWRKKSALLKPITQFVIYVNLLIVVMWGSIGIGVLAPARFDGIHSAWVFAAVDVVALVVVVHHLYSSHALAREEP